MYSKRDLHLTGIIDQLTRIPISNTALILTITYYYKHYTNITTVPFLLAGVLVVVVGTGDGAEEEVVLDAHILLQRVEVSLAPDHRA